MKESRPIRLRVDQTEPNHFTVSFARPGRIEVRLSREPGRRATLVAHVYDGTAIDIDQEPLGAYDGSLDEIEDWSA